MQKLLDPDEMPAWIAGLWPKSKRPTSVVAGVNDDDCAILRWKSPYLVATTDFLNANPIALELGIGSPWDLGRLVVAANLSDLCGSGALPVALLVGVTLPHKTAKAEFQNFMQGVQFESNLHGVPVVGGDSKLGKSRVVHAVALGSAKSKRQLFPKNGSKPGDILWVSGNVGSVAASVWGFRRSDLPPKWKTWARKSLLIPRLPLAASRQVSTSECGHGGTDISDGLGADLLELCKASSVGAIVDVERIPVAAEVKRAAKIAKVEPWRFAFASGGDFQFLVTTSKAYSGKMKKFGFTAIGEITSNRTLALRFPSSLRRSLPTKGHRDHRGLTFAQEIDFLIRTDLT